MSENKCTRCGSEIQFGRCDSEGRHLFVHECVSLLAARLADLERSAIAGAGGELEGDEEIVGDVADWLESFRPSSLGRNVTDAVAALRRLVERASESYQLRVAAKVSTALARSGVSFTGIEDGVAKIIAERDAMKARAEAAEAEAKELRAEKMPQHLEAMGELANNEICGCGKRPTKMDGSWRFNGQHWEHHHGYPVGHVECYGIEEYVADLNKQLEAAEARLKGFEGLVEEARRSVAVGDRSHPSWDWADRIVKAAAT